MASNWSVCGICTSLNEEKEGVVWCSECDQALCTDCEKRHSVSNATKLHQPVSIENLSQLPAQVLETKVICPVHDKVYQTYCGKHEILCCIECVLKEHKMCENVKSVEDVVKGIKQSHMFIECQETLTELSTNIEDITQDRESNAALLLERKQEIEEKVKDVRQKINEHLDRIESELLKSLHDLYEQENTKICSVISEMKKKQNSLEDIKFNLASIKDFASDMQAFLAIKDIERHIKTEEDNLQSIYTESSLDQISLSYVDKADMEKLSQMFGCVKVHTTASKLQGKSKKQKQAQKSINASSISVDDIQIELIQRVVVSDLNITGCQFISDSRYVYCSRSSNTLTVFKQNGSQDFRMSVRPFNIIDIAYIPSKNCIAATAGGDGRKVINVLDLNTKTIIKSMPVDTKNYGITVREGKLVYCAAEHGLRVIDIDENSPTTLNNVRISPFSYVSSFRNNLYFTDKIKHSVTCCDINGTTKWELKDLGILRRPLGVCVDQDGFVYVVGNKTINVIVISPDGLQYEELLSSKDGLNDPRVIDYDTSNDKLLIANGEESIFLFQVKK